MTKTPEEIARDYARAVIVKMGPSDFVSMVQGQLNDLAHEAFLAGYAAAQRWIPISKLEEDDGVVMLCDQDKEFWWGHKNEQDIIVYYHGNTIRSDRVFIGWLPLPPAPKEGE